MTIKDLVKYLYLELLKHLETENISHLSNLGIILLELLEVADQTGDMEIHSIFDDMLYIVRETEMGARIKGERVLPELESKVQEYIQVSQ